MIDITLESNTAKSNVIILALLIYIVDLYLCDVARTAFDYQG